MNGADQKQIQANAANKRQGRDRLVRLLIAAALLCLLIAGALLLLHHSRRASVFAEFSDGDALNGTADCCLNELTVLDRYAELTGEEPPSELLMASYEDRDGNTVVLSVLVNGGDPLRERLLPYLSDDDPPDTLAVLSGYFFAEPLYRAGEGAERAFLADADTCRSWSAEHGNDTVRIVKTVLTFAGGDEPSYLAAVRARTRGLRIAAAVFAALGLLSAAAAPAVSAIRRRGERRSERR